MFHAGAVAFVTMVGLRDGDLLFATERRFFERDLQIVTQIVAALRGGRILAAAKQIFKNAAAAAAAAEDFAEDVERIVESGAAAPTTRASRSVMSRR